MSFQAPRTSPFIIAAFSIWSLFSPRLALAECEAQLNQADLAGTAIAARAAYEKMEIDDFKQLVNKIRTDLPCLSNVIDPFGAATIHMLFGIEHFGDRKLEDATAAFAAARNASERIQLPEEVAPLGHPLHAAFNTVPLANSPYQQLQGQNDSLLFFDGQQSSRRSQAWPTIAQLGASNSAITQTVYLLPSQPLPNAELLNSTPPSPSTDAVAGSAPSHQREPLVAPKLRVPLLSVAGAALATTAILQITASGSASKYWDPSTDTAKLNDLRSTTNALNSASIATLVVGIGTGIGGALTWSW